MDHYSVDSLTPLHTETKIGFWCNDGNKDFLVHLLKPIRPSVIEVDSINAWLIGCVSVDLQVFIKNFRFRKLMFQYGQIMRVVRN